jgi:hypothetical protein
MTGALLLACARKQPAAQADFPLQALRIVIASEAEIGKLGPSGDDVVRRPWLGPIVQVLAEETPDALSYLRRSRADASGLGVDALFERGLANLRRMNTRPIHDDTVQMAKARVQITRSPDNYTAARFLLPELWSKVAADDGGPLFAAAPARDIVVWTTSVAEADHAALRRQAQVAFQSRSDPISPAILRWTGKGWELADANPIP